MADIPLQQRSGVDDVSRTIVPLPGLALEPVYNAAANVQKQTTADFEAQQMEKVKVKTIAAQNALNLIAEEQKRRGITPLRAQAVVGGDTFANRQFLKTAQEISRVMTIDQVHSDLQDELLQLRTDYLTHKGQMGYDPKNPEQDNAARYSAQAFAILKTYHEKYAANPFVDDVFDAQMTAKFTGTVNTFTKEIRELQATKIVKDYQIKTLDALQRKTAEWDDESLAIGFVNADNFEVAHKQYIERMVEDEKRLLYQLKDAGASDEMMAQAILSTHDDRTQEFKNGVVQGIVNKYKDEPAKLIAKINEFAAYIDKGGAFYKNQLMPKTEMADQDFGGWLTLNIEDLFKKNIAQGGEVYTDTFPSKAAFMAAVPALLETVKDPGTKDRLQRQYNTTLMELERSRLRGEGDGAARKALLDKMYAKDEAGALTGHTFSAWDDQMLSDENARVPDPKDPAAIGVLNPEDGDQLFSKAHPRYMLAVSNAVKRGNKELNDLATQVNQQRAAQGLPPFDLATDRDVDDFARVVADADIGTYMAQFAKENKVRARKEFASNPEIVDQASALPDATYKDMYKSTYAVLNDAESFQRQVTVIGSVFAATNGEHNVESDLERLDTDPEKAGIGLGKALVIARRVSELDVETSSTMMELWRISESRGKEIDEETAAELKVLKADALVRDYTSELDAIGAEGGADRRAFTERLLQGAYLRYMQGVAGGGALGDPQREIKNEDAAKAFATDSVKKLLEKVRTTTAVGENKGMGGRVWRLPEFIRASEPDIRALSYVVSPIEADNMGSTEMARDLGAAYDHEDLTDFRPVVVDNKVRFERIHKMGYGEPEYLIWLPNGTPTDTTKFTPDGTKLRLVQPVTGRPIEYTLDAFAADIEKEKAAALDRESLSRFRLLYPAAAAVTGSDALPAGQ